MKNIADFPDLIKFIKTMEGLSFKTYADQGGVLTIGYGHTGTDVVKGMIINQEQADNFLNEELQFALNMVYSELKGFSNDDGVVKALTSFVYNVGNGNFRSSTLLRMLNDPNPVDKKEISQQLLRWDHIKEHDVQVVSRGILNRRKKEQWCFNNGYFLGFNI